MHKIPERAITGTEGITAVRIRILHDNGTHAHIVVEDCGILVRPGQTYTVNTTDIQRR